jgi:hypothetical protein
MFLTDSTVSLFCVELLCWCEAGCPATHLVWEPDICVTD